MKYIFSTLSIIIGFASFAQNVEWQPLTREIAINFGDSIVKARILINTSNIKVEDEYIYYWHNKGQINRNMGGYSGEILHGEYFVINNKKQMITQGQFETGLKSGIWKRWYENGNLRSIENWKNGFLQGNLKTYNEDGSLLNITEYTKGQSKTKDEMKFKISMDRKFKTNSDSTLNDSIAHP